MLTEEIIWIAPGVLLLAGLVKGTIGIGLPTTIIALMSLFVDPRLAVALGLGPMILSNAWQVHREGGWRAPFARFWPLIAVSGVVMFIVSQWAAGVDGGAILAFTGGAIAVFAATSLIGTPPAMPASWERPAQVAAGFCSGAMGGLTGIWSPPVLILLLSRRLEKSEFVQTIGLLLLLGAAPLLAGYASAGLITWEIFLFSIALCIPVFAGFAVGERIRRRMGAERFQKIVLIFFLLMGLNMLRQAL